MPNKNEQDNRKAAFYIKLTSLLLEFYESGYRDCEAGKDLESSLRRIAAEMSDVSRKLFGEK